MARLYQEKGALWRSLIHSACIAVYFSNSASSGWAWMPSGAARALASLRSGVNSMLPAKHPPLTISGATGMIRPRRRGGRPATALGVPRNQEK